MEKYKIAGLGNVSLQCFSASQEFEKSIDQSLKDIIEWSWNKAVISSNGKLFDGTILNFVDVEFLKNRVLVKGNFISYKYFWAQRNVENVNLNIIPIGVSGILLTHSENIDYLVFAQRTEFNLQYQGYYELVPSGGINDQGLVGEINYYDQLMLELKEEIGLNTNSINEISSLGLLLDTTDKVYDVACLMKTKTCPDELRMLMKTSNEYENIEFIAVDDLHKFVERNKENIVPASIGLIEMFKQNNNNNNLRNANYSYR